MHHPVNLSPRQILHCYFSFPSSLMKNSNEEQSSKVQKRTAMIKDLSQKYLVLQHSSWKLYYSTYTITVTYLF